MDYSMIGALRQGWGVLYQGGTADAGIRAIPGPLWVVCMNRGEVDDSLVDHQPVYGLTVVAIADDPDAVLPDGLVLAGAHADAQVLSSSCNLIGHCAAGVSRSSYRNLATIMLARHLGFDEALALLRAGRPQANPNAGFAAQLRRLQPALMAGEP